MRWGAKHLRATAPGEGVAGDSDIALREARWLLEAAAVSAGRDPLFLLENGRVTDRVRAVYRSHIARRARGEPLAYVIGEASFRGIDLIVTPDVLIPRPETEGLVDIALEFLPRDRASRILDQGTGSGAIAIAIAMERPLARVTAIDISEPALAIAGRNVARHGLSERVTVEQADLYPSPVECFDMIVANLPYVPAGAALPDDVRDWEPSRALRGGKTGRELIERSLEDAERHLGSAIPRGEIPEAGAPRSAAHVVQEIGEEQRTGFEEWFRRRASATNVADRPRWRAPEFRTDLAGRIRYMIVSME